MSVDVEKGKSQLGWKTFFLIALIGGLICVLYVHFNRGFTAKWEAVVVGISTNVIVALCQVIWFSSQRSKFRKLESKLSRLSSLKVTDVLFDREDEAHYRGLIENAKERIDVMGTTASRFMNDFADSESKRNEKKVLISALARGVKVRILVANKKGLSADDASKKKIQDVLPVLQQLARKFEGQFEYGYYNHPAMHSIVRADSQCIVGPKFEEKESRYTPAIQMDISSDLTKAYMEHFEEEWKIKKSNP